MNQLYIIKFEIRRFLASHKRNDTLISCRKEQIHFIETVLTDLYTRMNIDLDMRLSMKEQRNSVPPFNSDTLNRLTINVTERIQNLVRSMGDIIAMTKTMPNTLLHNSLNVDGDGLNTLESLRNSNTIYRNILQSKPRPFKLESLPEFEKVFDKCMCAGVESNTPPCKNKIVKYRVQVLISQVVQYTPPAQPIHPVCSPPTIHEFKSIIFSDSYDTIAFHQVNAYLDIIVDALRGNTTAETKSLLSSMYSSLLLYYIGGGTSVAECKIKNRIDTSPPSSSMDRVIFLLNFGPLLKHCL